MPGGDKLSNDDAARINSLVDSVTVAKEPAFLRFDIIDQLGHVLGLADVLDDFERGVDRASVEGSVRSRDGRNGATERIGERRRDVEKSGGGIREFVVCVEHPKLLETVDVLGIGLLGVFFDESHHTERVCDERSIRICGREWFLLHARVGQCNDSGKRGYQSDDLAIH